MCVQGAYPEGWRKDDSSDDRVERVRMATTTISTTIQDQGDRQHESHRFITFTEQARSIVHFLKTV